MEIADKLSCKFSVEKKALDVEWDKWDNMHDSRWRDDHMQLVLAFFSFTDKIHPLWLELGREPEGGGL